MGSGPVSPKPACSWPRVGEALAQGHTAIMIHVAASSSLITQPLTPGAGSEAQKVTAIWRCTPLGLNLGSRAFWIE